MTTKLCSILLSAVLSLVSLLAIPAPSWAAATRSTLEPAAALTESAEATDIAADKIDRFAQAYLQVLKLLSDREPELPAAETAAESLKIQQSIEADAVAIIEASGLTMPDYMEILGLASQDDTFRDKVLGRMDDALEP
ncbi:MAG: DUF4168 domain-containing protein [Cyanobacteria bacterium J06634_5]